MCVHTWRHVYVCVHACMETCMCVHVYTEAHVCVRMCTCLCMSIGGQLYVCACMYEDTYLFVHMRGAQRTTSGAVPSEASNGFFVIVSH